MTSQQPLDLAALLSDKRWLAGVARGLVGNEQAIEDVLQETRLSVWRHPPADTLRAGGWIRRIASNLALRMRSSEAARRLREDAVARPERTVATDELAARVEMQRAVAEAILRLGEPYRAAILLRFFDDLPPREIAGRLGVPVETVRTRLKRGLAQLRGQLDRRYGARDAWSGFFAPGLAGPGGVIAMSTASKVVVTSLAVLVLGVVAWRIGAPAGSPDGPSLDAAPDLGAVAKLDPKAAPSTSPAAELAATPTPSEPSRSVAAAAPAVTSAPVSGAAPGVAKLKVLVVDKHTRAPLARVRVTEALAVLPTPKAGRQTPESGWADMTNQSGALEFDVPGDAAIVVTADGSRAGAGSAHVDVAAMGAGTTNELTLELETNADLVFWLQAIDEETRAPLADALLRPADGGAEKARADARGLLSIATLSSNPGVFRLESRDHAFVYAQANAGHAAPEKALVVALARSATLIVRVFDASGAPLADASVTLTTQSYPLVKPDGVSLSKPSSLTDPGWRKNTGSDGRAVFDELPARVPIALAARGSTPWRLPAALVLRPGETRDVECRIGSGTIVEGRIVDQFDKPVRHRSVRLEPAQRKVSAYFLMPADDRAKLTSTDDDGRFVFEDVALGTWWIGPNARRDLREDPDSDDVAPLARVLEIVEGVKRTTADIRADRGLTIRGRVLDSRGDPCGRANISARTGSDGTASFARVKSDGTFKLGPLSAGSYQIVATDGHDAPSPPITAEAGHADVVLHLSPGVTLLGRVVDASGVGAAARVDGMRRDPSSPRAGTCQTSEDGSFAFRGLDPGVLDLVATTADGRLGILERVVGDRGANITGLVVRVQSAGRVRVRYSGEQDIGTVSLIANDVTIGTRRVDHGATVEMASPLGKITLRLSVAGRASSVDREVDVRAGEPQEIVLSESGR